MFVFVEWFLSILQNIIIKPLAPGGWPRPDDQGNLDVCTRFAMSKAVICGFMKKMYVLGEKIDINQESMIQVLLNEHKDVYGKWPDQFNSKRYQLMDAKRR